MVKETKNPAETAEQQDNSKQENQQEVEKVQEEEVVEEETVESLKAKNEEAQRKISELGERTSRQEELLRLSLDMMKGTPAGKKEEVSQEDELDKYFDDLPYDKTIDDPKLVIKAGLKKAYLKAKEDAKRELIDDYQRSQQFSESSRKSVETFYSNYPELKGNEELVDIYAYQVMNEHPEWSVEKKFDEVSKRTKNKITAIRKGVGKEKPDNLEGAGGEGITPKVKPVPTPKGAKEQVEDYFAERRKDQAKKLQG